MNPLVFWNELAERPVAQDSVHANKRMDEFVDAMAALQRAAKGLPPLRLRMHVDPNSIELAPGHFLSTWIGRTDQTRRLLFRQLAAAAPLLQAQLDQATTLDRFGCSECKVFGTSGFGFRAAWASGELAASLASDTRWSNPTLEIELTVLGDDGVLVESADTVRHAATAAHAAAHSAWFEERARTSVRDGRDAWERRATLFPHLEFCKEIEARLCALDAGSEQLRSVIRRLREMDVAFSTWDGRPIHSELMPTKCTPETQRTLKDEANEHTATRIDGSSKLFSWHVRYTPGAGRIFFDGDPRTKRGIVGYVGIKKDGKLT